MKFGISSSDVGREMAYADFIEQAEVVNKFAGYLHHACEGDGIRVDMQLGRMAGSLSQEGRELVRALHHFIELAEKMA